MAAQSTAKIIAKLIKAYRAAYVSAAQMGTVGGPRQALLRAILGTKFLQPDPSIKLLQTATKNPEEFIKLLRSITK